MTWAVFAVEKGLFRATNGIETTAAVVHILLFVLFGHHISRNLAVSARVVIMGADTLGSGHRRSTSTAPEKKNIFGCSFENKP